MLCVRPCPVQIPACLCSISWALSLSHLFVLPVVLLSVEFRQCCCVVWTELNIRVRRDIIPYTYAWRQNIRSSFCRSEFPHVVLNLTLCRPLFNDRFSRQVFSLSFVMVYCLWQDGVTGMLPVPSQFSCRNSWNVYCAVCMFGMF